MKTVAALITISASLIDRKFRITTRVIFTRPFASPDYAGCAATNFLMITDRALRF